jgi:hypothetical protein
VVGGGGGVAIRRNRCIRKQRNARNARIKKVLKSISHGIRAADVTEV